MKPGKYRKRPRYDGRMSVINIDFNDRRSYLYEAIFVNAPSAERPVVSMHRLIEAMRDLGEREFRPGTIWATYRRREDLLYEAKEKARPMRRALNRPARMPASAAAKEYLLAEIRRNAYPGEKLEMSLSRLAMAAARCGYETLDFEAVNAAYAIFRQLTERPYVK